MIFEVVTGDTVRTVAVTRAGHLLHVAIGGRTVVVDARRVGDMALSLLVQPDAGSTPAPASAPLNLTELRRGLAVAAIGRGGGQSVDVSLAAARSVGDFDVHLGGRRVPVQIRPAGGFGRQKKSAAAAGTGPQRIAAPMPGRIVRVLVAAGDEVKARQGLVVVEAMKMENELRAARDGRVRAVSVVEGQSVEAGAILLVVE
jgi:biotin carboxyl carrier protein